MAAAPSWQDYYDLGKAEAIDRRPELSFFEGDISDMLVAGAAAMADRLTGWAADRVRATYLDGARGDDLTTLADDHWATQRRSAVKSVGAVTFTRASAANGAGTYAAGELVGTAKDANGNEVRFLLDTTLSYGALETGPKVVNVTAEFGGKAGNVAAGLVTRIIGTIWDSNITVSNVAAMAGGADAETDDQLRERVRGLPQSFRRATLKALEFGALTVSGVATATAVEETDGVGALTGRVFVYISDASGGSNPTLIANVETELDNWRAAGSLVNVEGGTLYIQTISLTLVVKAGVDTNALVANIQNAIVARLEKLKIGETLYRTQIKSAAISVDPDNIVEVNVITPALDVAPSANQVIRTTTADITVS